MQPEITILAGANGAGKTTFSKRLLAKNGQRFVNADEIALKLNPEAPWTQQVRAGRILLQEVDTLAEARQSFVLETTLSGKTLVQRVKQWQASGCRISLIYIYLDDFHSNIKRVQHRVLHGGHNIPEADIVRRYHRSVFNFQQVFLPIVDKWFLYKNGQSGFQLIADNHGQRTQVLHVNDYREFFNLPPTNLIVEDPIAPYGGLSQSEYYTQIGNEAVQDAIRESFAAGIPICYHDEKRGQMCWEWPDGSITYENPYPAMLRARGLPVN